MASAMSLACTTSPARVDALGKRDVAVEKAREALKVLEGLEVPDAADVRAALAGWGHDPD
jgi:hypothetical protein